MPFLSRFLRLALWLWALPLTLCGMPLWLLMYFRSRRERLRGSHNFMANQAVVLIKNAQAAPVFVAYGAPVVWLLKRHPLGEMDAMALGCCIFAQDETACKRTLAHEMVHVQQALQWGLLFPLAYALSSGWQKCRGRCPYTNNYFEREANRPYK